ncbi:MAG: hypothetical protein AAF604_24450 [Acidobacteriota bacterium]
MSEQRERIESSRRRVEESLQEVRSALSSELGSLAPRRRAWMVGILAAAAGLALGLKWKARRDNRRR